MRTRTQSSGKMAYTLRRTQKAGKTAYRLRTQKAGKIPVSMHHKIDILGNTLRKQKMVGNADTLRSPHSGDNGAARGTRRSHNQSEDGDTWPSRKRRSRRN
jgi:hypothetical protein